MTAIMMASAALALYLVMVLPALDGRRWSMALDLSRNSLIFAVLGVGVISLLFWRQIELVPILLLIVAVHEYGHVLAFRLAGHPRPVFRLMPFGGVAFSDRRSKSQAENAFIALMGPGFCIPLMLAALVAIAVTLPEGASMQWSSTTLRWEVAMPGSARLDAYEAAVIWAAIATLQWSALLNFLNLFPFYPLDGGRTVRSVASRLGWRFASRLTYALTIAIGVLGLLAGSIFVIIVAVIGLAAAKQEETLDRKLEPISNRDMLLTLGAYLTMLAFFGYYATPLLVRFVPALAPLFGPGS